MKVHLNLQAAPNRTSGIGVYTHEIARRLAGRAHLDLTGGFSSLRTRTVPLFDAYGFPVRISHVPARLLYAPPAGRRLPLSYSALMHDRSDTSVFFANALPAARLRGRVVVVVHDLIPLRIPLELPGIVARYRRQLEDIGDRADVVVTVSQASKDDIVAETGIGPERVVIVPNGIDSTAYAPILDEAALASVRERYGLPDRYVLYFGGTRPYKNVARLVEAYSRLSGSLRDEVKLVVTRQDPELQARAAALDIADSVVFTPPVRDEDKAAVYHLADVSVLVSLYEGFGIPVIEAMAAGTPVIASNVSSLPEVCGGAALLVDPLDTDALACRLEEVLDDQDLRASLSTRGLANASRYSWDASADLFDTMLTGDPARVS
ncbi:MAG TPA: glycosyltransferase family 1 protein [Propionibacteriaceae bacterium]|nr:glycosyltransferase family 1 protein [Propionibacteriaceae bacterium]